MAKRRTKQQKAGAEQRRSSQVSFSLSEIVDTTPAGKSASSARIKSASTTSSTRSAAHLVMTDPKLILGDLLKTTLVSGVILSVLLGIGMLQ